jgi:hypothetical protein
VGGQKGGRAEGLPWIPTAAQEGQDYIVNTRQVSTAVQLHNKDHYHV